MKWRFRKICGTIAFAAYISFSSLLMAAESITIESFTLDNGLRVIVAPNHRSPVISHNLLFYAGAADDPNGASGVAHYLEHMLFKGTEKVPEGEYNARIEAMGGQHNAYTSADMTGYYVTIAREYLPEVMELEADRMMNLAPSQEAYAKEREVILEERRLRTDTQPAALLAERIDAALFPHHPYGTPIIGWAHEMQQLDEVKARKFLDRFYTPHNAVLLLVGDITAKEARRLAEKYYGQWEGAPKPSRIWVQDPPVNATYTVTLKDERVNTPRWSRHYIAPSFGTANNFNQVMPLLFAEELLGNGRTGWLYRRLVREKKLATSVSVYYNPFSIGNSAFSVSIQPAAGISLQQTEQAYEEAIQQFASHKISDKEMQRARNQMLASTVFARDSLQGMGFILAQIVMIGLEPEWFNRWESLVDAVQPEQVITVISDVVKHEHAVTGYLLPEEGKAHE